MAKGDYVIVKSEIAGNLITDEVQVTGNGGKIEVEWDKKLPILRVSQLTRNGNPTVVHEFATSAVRSVTQKIKDES